MFSLLEEALEGDKRPLIVNGLKIVLLEPNLKVSSNLMLMLEGSHAACAGLLCVLYLIRRFALCLHK